MPCLSKPPSRPTAPPEPTRRSTRHMPPPGPAPPPPPALDLDELYVAISYCESLLICRVRILVYPPSGTGAINITRADFNRLNPTEYLNDTLIEFGLKWVCTSIG